MKYLVWVMVMAVGVLFAAAPWVIAEVTKTDDTAAVKAGDAAPVKDGVEKKAEVGSMRHFDRVGHIEKVVGGLTVEQKAKLADLDKVRMEKVRAAFTEFHDGVLSVLTPEQKDKYEANYKAWMEKHDKAKAECKMEKK